MVKLFDSGVYLLNGKTLVPENEAVGLDKMFKDLFLLSVANVAINVLLSALGIFSLGGIFY
jgi:hypothetical protein